MSARLQRRSLLTALALCPLCPGPAHAQPSGSAGTAAADPPGAQRRVWPPRQSVPRTVLPAWEGPAWSLEQARGKVVLLNFWASWCAPCRAEIPSLEAFAARHERDGVEVLAVNFRETEGALRRFLASMPLALTVLRDVDGTAARAWQVSIYPSTVVIGRDGRPAFTVVGELDWTGPVAASWLSPMIQAVARS
jgi:thiol-disulfide isomerase/thioredoxin